MPPKTRVYSEKEAEIYGRRRICHSKGHDIELSHLRGGIQMQYDRKPGEAISGVDIIKCNCCDAVFTVTYPEIGTVIS